jgi:hypothetical protein
VRQNLEETEKRQKGDRERGGLNLATGATDSTDWHRSDLNGRHLLTDPLEGVRAVGANLRVNVIGPQKQVRRPCVDEDGNAA